MPGSLMLHDRLLLIQRHSDTQAVPTANIINLSTGWAQRTSVAAWGHYANKCVLQGASTARWLLLPLQQAGPTLGARARQHEQDKTLPASSHNMRINELFSC